MPLPRGITVGHWSDPVGRTGCTVVLAPEGAVSGVDVRGAAPATLGTEALAPGHLVERAHAVLLTGGSAFGLAAAAGVMRYLEEHEIGFEFAGIRVPIVAGAVIFDLFEGDPHARPGATAGYDACSAMTIDPEIGAVGAGTGATVAKAGDRSETRPGGVGIATARVGDAHVSAVMVSNSVGGIWDDERHEWVAPLAVWTGGGALRPGTSTAIGVIATDARVTKEQANRTATVAHDGIARAIRPSHTMYDGDAIFCLATGSVDAPYDLVEVAAAQVVARAIVDGVRAAQR
jgi:L-aminopeptidase/D-esterase-like protein